MNQDKQGWDIGSSVIYQGRKSQIISAPKDIDGMPHVLIANVGIWVPISELKDFEA